MALNGCGSASSTLDSAGPAAHVIAELWWIMLAGGTVIFLLVMVLLALAFRPRLRAAGEARQVRVWIIALGLAFPMVVLIALLTVALAVGERLLPRADADAVQVAAEGRRWSWTFAYADAPDRTTVGELHIPAGRPVDVAVTSVDVIHSFWVPRLAGKLDAIPGQVNVLRIEADEAGTFRGLSAEFSGAGYDHFSFLVTAHDPASWADFIEGDAE